MKVLYFTNVAAEYRIPFFAEMEKKMNIKFIITKQGINKKVYDFGVDIEKVNNIVFLPEKIITHFIKLIKILITTEYDICVIPALDSFSEMMDVLIIVMISSIRKKKKVFFWEKWQPKECYIPLKKKLKNRMQKISFDIIKRNLDLVLVPGEKGKKYFEEYLKFSKEKIKKVINASSISKNSYVMDIRKLYNIDKNIFIVLYFGRVVNFKGLDLLIKAMSKISDKDIQLMVCGDGEFLRENKELANKFELDVIFAGKVNKDEREAYFRAADTFVLPSRIYNGGIEAWGLTVNEAMDLSVPCILSDVVGCSYDLIKPNINGLIFENENEDELKKCILKLKYEPSLREDIIRNAKKTVEEVYNYEKMAESFIDSFESIY